MIRLQCRNCDKKLSVNDDLAGRVGVCPGCKHKIQIPQPEAIEIEEDADEAIPRRRPRPSRRSPPEKTRRPAADENEEDEKPVRRSRQTADDADEEDEKPVERSYRPAADEDEDVESPAPPRRGGWTGRNVSASGLPSRKRGARLTKFRGFLWEPGVFSTTL